MIKEKAARGKVRFRGEQMTKPTKKSCGRILHTLHGVEFWWCAGLPRRSCMWPTWKHRMPLSGHTIPVRRLPPIIWEVTNVAILFIYLFIYIFGYFSTSHRENFLYLLFLSAGGISNSYYKNILKKINFFYFFYFKFIFFDVFKLFWCANIKNNF